MIECKYCKKLFQPPKKTSQFCSRDCVWEFRKGQNPQKPRERECGFCGKKFMAGTHNKTYCSKECAKAIKRISCQLPKPKEKKKPKKIKSLAEMQREARKLNMSYGEYDTYLRLQKGAI